MHLYTTSASPNGKRVAVVLAEKGIDVEMTEIDLQAGENLSDDFKAKNPSGRVPVLETDSGLMIAESVAISRYLEGLQPEPNLFGEGHEEQAVIDMWNRRAELNLMMPVAQAFRNLSGFFKDREKISQEWGEISAEVARNAAQVFETQLGESEYIAGNRFTIADVTLAVTLNFAKMTGQDLTTTPNIARYLETVTSRPSF